MSPKIKKVLRWLALTVGVIVLFAVGLGMYVYTLIPRPIGEKPVLQAELFNKPSL